MRIENAKLRRLIVHLVQDYAELQTPAPGGLSCRGARTRRASSARMFLNSTDPQTGEAVVIDRILPIEEFVDSKCVAVTGFFER
jgi:hypothetical protein